MPTNSTRFIAWKSKGLSQESIKSFPTSDNSLGAGLNYINNAKYEQNLMEVV